MNATHMVTDKDPCITATALHLWKNTLPVRTYVSPYTTYFLYQGETHVLNGLILGVFI
jgi:hypothetical protein